MQGNNTDAAIRTSWLLASAPRAMQTRQTHNQRGGTHGRFNMEERMMMMNMPEI